MTSTKALPPLSGVIITHSDRDHSGNAHSLLVDLSQGTLKDFVTFDQSQTSKVPVYLTPMVQWTRDGGPKSSEPFFKVQSAGGEIKVQLVIQAGTVN